MERYLQRLQKRVHRPIRVMQSNGGSLTVAEASQEAVRTLLSGPAGGALGARQVARRAGHRRLLTLDMGGTSTDMSLIDGDLELTSEALLGGHPVKTPMLRIDTIGAGGGSIAWIDAGGALRVGPRSAGAEPGPICYGRGGTQVTVTDAHVWLGRISPRHFLGGAMEIFPKKILSPLSKLAHRLKLSLDEAAAGVVKVANANMARSLRVLSLERGHDPRRFTLMPFGGAGGLHAAELAEELGIPSVLVPRDPGILSAYGMAFADWRRDAVQTVLLAEQSASLTRLREGFAKLEAGIRRAARREGISERSIRFAAGLDVRYQGQSYELTIPMGAEIRRRFEAVHRQRFGHLHWARPVEIVNLRLQGGIPAKQPSLEFHPSTKGNRVQAQESVLLYWRGRRLPCPVLLREALPRLRDLRGPALIAEYSASTFVPPGWKLRHDRFGNLILNQQAEGRSRHG
jgi:N-methylhydantoinase A